MIASASPPPEDEPDGTSPTGVLRLAIVFEGGMALVAFALGQFLARPPQAQIQGSWRDLATGLVATAPLCLVFLLLLRSSIPPLRRLRQVVEEMLVPLMRGQSLAGLAVISLCAGLGEELLFRGLVQEAVITLSDRPWLGVLVGAVAFGLAHPITPSYAVLAGLMGLYFGWLTLATENLLVPIVTHAVYDFLALAYLVRRDARRQS